MKIKLDDLRTKVSAGVSKLGYKNEDANIIAEVLLYAQLRGNNQGITKIATGGVPKASDIQELKVVKENKCGALLSGGHSMVATAQTQGYIDEQIVSKYHIDIDTFHTSLQTIQEKINALGLNKLASDKKPPVGY